MKQKSPKAPEIESVWSPFQYPIFKMLWITSLISNIGTWMHEVSAAWLMTTLTHQPLLVALVQATTATSVCLLAIPAGALADILDKRRYLIILQSWMMLMAGVLAIVTFSGKITPTTLLLLTFCLGAGTALNVPTWQAMVPELVPAKGLVAAITLNSMGVNFARTIGPAFAGLIIATLGPAAVFAINALSFLGILFALYLWKRKAPESTLPGERFLTAMRSGIRYVKGSPPLKKILVKSSFIFFFVSAIWALLPLVTRTLLHQGAICYGIFLAILGSGAVFGALNLHKIRQHLNIDRLIFSGAVLFAIAMLLIGVFKNLYLTGCAMFLTGLAWIAVLTTLNSIVQQAVPSWVRARAMSVYLMTFFASMAIGGVLWGWIASHFNIATALILPSIGLIITNIFSYRLVIENNLNFDHTPSMDMPPPPSERELDHDEGPVMITVEYRVAPENAPDFRLAIQELKHTRLREGAFFWSLFNNVEKPTHFMECFMVESWLEHLRFHERVSVTDRKIQKKVNSFQIDEKKPHTTHFIAYGLQKNHHIKPKKKK